MRDGNIHQLNQQLEKKIAFMYKQIQFLDCRQQAYEMAFNSFWSFAFFIFNRKSFMKNVDKLQLALLQQHDEKIHEMVRQKKEEAMKPKLTLPPSVSSAIKIAVVLISVVSLSSCVTQKKYKKGINAAYAEGYEANKFDCDLKLQAQDKKIASLVERLEKFNQVDANGELRPLKPAFKGKAGGSDPVKGDEPWLK